MMEKVFMILLVWTSLFGVFALAGLWVEWMEQRDEKKRLHRAANARWSQKDKAKGL